MYRVSKISGYTVELSKNNGHGGTSSTSMPVDTFKKNYGKDPKEGDMVEVGKYNEEDFILLFSY